MQDILIHQEVLKEHILDTNISDVLGDIKDRVSPKLWGYEAHQEKKWKKEGKRGESLAPRPQGHGVSQRGNQSRRDRIVPKKVPEDWKKIDNVVQTDRAKELEERAGKGIPYGKSLWKTWLDNITKPIPDSKGGRGSFQHCIDANQDKNNPGGWCKQIERKISKALESSK